MGGEGKDPLRVLGVVRERDDTSPLSTRHRILDRDLDRAFGASNRDPRRRHLGVGFRERAPDLEREEKRQPVYVEERTTARTDGPSHQGRRLREGGRAPHASSGDDRDHARQESHRGSLILRSPTDASHPYGRHHRSARDTGARVLWPFPGRPPPPKPAPPPPAHLR